MNVKTFQAPDKLKPFIRGVYQLDMCNPTSGQKSLRTIADGCPGIIYQDVAKGRLVRGDKVLPETFLFGQSTTHADIDVSGSMSVMVFCLYPNALNYIFGLNAELLTDDCLNLDELNRNYQLLNRLNDEECKNQKVEVMNRFLISRLGANTKANNRQEHYAMQRMIATNGSISLDDLHNSLGMSERNFERRFKQYVGISPKLFSRICRFQASLQQCNNGLFDTFSAVAYENNFSDQSHFIRSFKEFTGFTPNQYRKYTSGVAENLTELNI